MRLLFAGISLLLATAHAQSTFRIQTLAGSNVAGDGPNAAQAVLQQLEGIAAAPDGTLFLADAADHRIRALAPDGAIRTIAGDGSPGASGDNGPAAKARLRSPYGLSLDRNGNLYVADLGNARIRLISPDGAIRTVAGGGSLPATPENEGSPATSLKLLAPRNVLADPNGGFYFSDFDAHRVYYVDYRGILTIFAGTDNPGYGADNIAATRSALRNPAGLAFEPLGGLVIVESGSQRLRRVARGIVTAYLADALRNYPLYSPTGIAFDPAGNLYLADARSTGALKRTPQGEIVALPLSGRAVAALPAGGAAYAWNATVYRIDAANKSTLLAGAASSLADLTGDGGPAESARLLAPAGLAYDREGNLYIADERAHRIRRVTPAGLISTIAGTGRPAYSGDGGPAAKAALNAPRGLAFHPSGTLFIADSANHAVRAIAPNGLISTVAGNGFSGYRGDGGPASAAQLNTPSALAVHPNGELYIADSANHRVRRISAAGLISTFAGTGAPGLQYDGAAAVFAQLNLPAGLAFDPAGNLYIADAANNRVRRVDPTGLLTTIAGPDFLSPAAVATAPDGAILVADTGRHRICQIVDNTVTPIAGAPEPGFSGDGGPALDAQFQSPSALALDPQGNIAIADTGNGRVRQLRPELLLISGETQSPARLFHAATGEPVPAVPGLLATLRGVALGPESPVPAPDNAPWPRVLAGVEVRVDNLPAPLLYVSPEQINLLIPDAVRVGPDVKIEVFYRQTPTATLATRTAAAAPGLFPQAVNANGSLNAPDNPAARGSVVTLFLAGAGAQTAEIPQIRLGALPAEVVRFSLAAPGLHQLDVRLPSGFYAPGSYPVQLKLGAVSAPAGPAVQIN